MHSNKEEALMSFMGEILLSFPTEQRHAIYRVLTHGVEKHGADQLASPLHHLAHGLEHLSAEMKDPGCYEAESGELEWAHASARCLLALYALKEQAPDCLART
jgi:hypothetical protein